MSIALFQVTLLDSAKVQRVALYQSGADEVDVLFKDDPLGIAARKTIAVSVTSTVLLV